MGALAPTTSAIELGVTVTEATGIAVTVIVAAVLFPSLVAVMVTVPGATALTTPTLETVAIPGLSVDHCTARPLSVAPSPSNVVALRLPVAPTISDNEDGVTVIVATGAGGTGETVICALPVFPSVVATTLAVPAVSVVIRPVADTVATEGLSELQVTARTRTLWSASKVDALACTVAPAITELVASVTSTDATGMAVTLITAVALFPSLVAVIVAVPGETALIKPLSDTVATDALSDDQATTRSMSALFAASLIVAVS
jgi:hypothetical protein